MKHSRTLAFGGACGLLGSACGLFGSARGLFGSAFGLIARSVFFITAASAQDQQPSAALAQADQRLRITSAMEAPSRAIDQVLGEEIGGDEAFIQFMG